MTKRKHNMSTRYAEHTRAAMVHEAVHAAFFNRPPVNVREVRNRLDPVLKTQAIREILKINITNKEDSDE